MILQSKSTYILWTKLTPSTAGLKFALSLSTAKNCHRMLPFPLSNTPAKFVILQPSYWTNRYCNFRSKYSNMPTNMLIKHSPLWPVCEAKGCCSVSNLWSYPLVLPIGCPLAQMVIQRNLTYATREWGYHCQHTTGSSENQIQPNNIAYLKGNQWYYHCPSKALMSKRSQLHSRGLSIKYRTNHMRNGCWLY